ALIAQLIFADNDNVRDLFFRRMTEQVFQPAMIEFGAHTPSRLTTNLRDSPDGLFLYLPYADRQCIYRIIRPGGKRGAGFVNGQQQTVYAHGKTHRRNHLRRAQRGEQAIISAAAADLTDRPEIVAVNLENKPCVILYAAPESQIDLGTGRQHAAFLQKLQPGVRRIKGGTRSGADAFEKLLQLLERRCGRPGD